MSNFAILDDDLTKKLVNITYDYYPKETFKRAVKNPVFLHFCGGTNERPWFNNYHPYRKLYEEYAELSGYDKNKIFKNKKIPLKPRIFFKFAKNPLLIKLLVSLYPNFIINKNDHNGTDKYIRENLNVNNE